MRSEVVVGEAPYLDDVSSFIKRRETVELQALVSEPPIEALDRIAFDRSAWPNEPGKVPGTTSRIYGSMKPAASLQVRAGHL